jgi:hypothetical protein
MAQRVGQKVKLSSIDELLGVPSMEGTVDLDVMTIYPFENHPFRVVDDEKMDELVESIKESGVLTPVLVRPDDEGNYEMISGHRRLHAAKRAGLRKIPAIIKGRLHRAARASRQFFTNIITRTAVTVTMFGIRVVTAFSIMSLSEFVSPIIRARIFPEGRLSKKARSRL